MGLDALPAGDLMEQGLRDLDQGIDSISALLVSIGSPRLRRLGLSIPNPIEMPEQRLYERLHQANPDGAHSQYNALIRRLVSFEHCAECVS
jgi:hypothetical protein